MSLRYRHDCDVCVFLEAFDGFDLYFCSQRELGLPTIVARYGDKGEHYKSMPIVIIENPPSVETEEFKKYMEPFYEGLKRAKEKGLVKK